MILTAKDLIELKKKLPNTAIISIMQSTKEGNFKGSQEYFHDCDIFLEVNNQKVFQKKARSMHKIELVSRKLDA